MIQRRGTKEGLFDLVRVGAGEVADTLDHGAFRRDVSCVILLAQLVCHAVYGCTHACYLGLLSVVLNLYALGSRNIQRLYIKGKRLTLLSLLKRLIESLDHGLFILGHRRSVSLSL